MTQDGTHFTDELRVFCLRIGSIHYDTFILHLLQNTFFYFHRFGFVTFNSIEDATTAKGMYQGQYLDGRKVMIRYETKSTINTKVSLAERTNRVVNDSKKFTRDSNQEPTTKLMIRNLSFKTTDESLQKLFKNAASTHIAMDGKTGQSRG